MCAECEDGGGRGLEKGIVTLPRMAADKGVKCVGEREHDMEILDRQRGGHLLLRPACVVHVLADGAVPVPAGVEYEFPLAACAVVDRSPEIGRPAGNDMPEDLGRIVAWFVGIEKVAHVFGEDFVYNVSQGSHPLPLSMGLTSFEKCWSVSCV